MIRVYLNNKAMTTLIKSISNPPVTLWPTFVPCLFFNYRQHMTLDQHGKYCSNHYYTLHPHSIPLRPIYCKYWTPPTHASTTSNQWSPLQYTKTVTTTTQHYTPHFKTTSPHKIPHYKSPPQLQHPHTTTVRIHTTTIHTTNMLLYNINQHHIATPVPTTYYTLHNNTLEHYTPPTYYFIISTNITQQHQQHITHYTTTTHYNTTPTNTKMQYPTDILQHYTVQPNTALLHTDTK